MPKADAEPFWQAKRLDQMTEAEWESLCDGCGRCCLHKLRDEDSGALSYTNVACRLLDTTSCQCSNYANRRDFVPDCVSLTAKMVRELDWLPPSCAYRRLSEGRGLAPWHPLITGDKFSPHAAGASVAGRVISEEHAGNLEYHLVDWPQRDVPHRWRRR
jgi:uncharacterized cysteine cluster protein YcgN (CxxCxxCC family)